MYDEIDLLAPELYLGAPKAPRRQVVSANRSRGSAAPFVPPAEEAIAMRYLERLAEQQSARDARKKAMEEMARSTGLAPVTVYCTVCGEQHHATRAAAEKWRKCSTCMRLHRKAGDEKYCRQCGCVMHRSQYHHARGWRTVATCVKCRK